MFRSALIESVDRDVGELTVRLCFQPNAREVPNADFGAAAA
jgi:hypothetical protein